MNERPTAPNPEPKERKPTRPEVALAYIRAKIEDDDRGADLKKREWIGVDQAFAEIAKALAPEGGQDAAAVAVASPPAPGG